MTMFQIVILLAIFAAVQSADRCPNGFHQHKMSCYMVSKMETTFLSAEAYCNEVQSHLVAVETEEERVFLNQHTRFLHGSSIQLYWTGGINYVDGSWMWGHTLESISNLRWSSGEPTKHETEHCLVTVERTGGLYADNDCTSRNAFICEHELNSKPIG